MDTASLLFLPISELISRVRKRVVSPVELVEALLAEVERLNPTLNAFISVSDRAREDARRAEEAIVRGKATGLLHGVPVSVKDLIFTRDFPTTAGSRVFDGGIQSRGSEAPAVRALRRAGAIVFGKNNLHEFAFGITNENAHFGPARNPWNPGHVTGGSSGGSAAAVAAGLGYASLGTDTRGSIRIPATCCGVTGLKPTRGRVSIRGVIPLSPTLDHVGPLTRTCADAALVLKALVDPGAVRPNAHPVAELRALRLGICEYYFRDLDPDVEAAVREALDIFRALGPSVREVEIPGLDEALHASGVVAAAEALLYHDAFLRSRPGGYGEAVRRRLEKGYRLPALDYLRALETRRTTRQAFRRIFQQIDCLVAPGLPVPAPPIGSTHVRTPSGDGDILHQFVRLSAPQNVAGVPALALPCGFSRSGLPIGLQLVGPAGADERLLALGSLYQAETDWHRRRPPVAAAQPVADSQTLTAS